MFNNSKTDSFHEVLWKESFPEIEKVVDKITFETIVKNIYPQMEKEDELNLIVERTWQRDYIVKFLSLIEEIISKKAGRHIKVKVIVRSNGKGSGKREKVKVQPKVYVIPKKKASSCPSTHQNFESERSLDPRYTFETFIVGSGNRFAAAAAQAVAESPATAYNPLFIYGGVGLGKTHLINAIGHRVLEKNPNIKVVYVSAEKFLNDMIESIQEQKMKEFRKKYRSVNVLLIDDIQFIKNKESMQEEFFHTFNELHSANSQIVITSDRPPKDIPTLEDRLRSRFEWGLIADISPPDIETRMAILKKKAEIENIEVPNQVIQYIAEKIPSNIRELEGALNRVICYASLLKQPITMDLALSALKGLLPDSRPKHITIKFIQEKTCEYYNIRMEEMLGKCRDSRLVIPRQVAMYLSKELLGSSFPNIGKAFGGRDHTTIMHAYKKIKKLLKKPSMKNDIENIKNMLKNYG